MTRLEGHLLFPDTHYIVVMIGFFFGCIFWLASLVGGFVLPNGFLFDHLSSMITDDAGSQSQVLLLEIEPQWRQAGDEVWMPLLNKLQEQGAEQILFTFMPLRASRDFYHLAQQSDNVIFSRRPVRATSGSLAFLGIKSFPDAAQGLNLMISAYAISASEFGVYRRQSYSFPVGEGQSQVMSLEAMASGHNMTKLEKSPYLVNFMEAPQRLPHLSAIQVLHGKVPSKMIKGRSVLIGVNETEFSLYTPLATSGYLLTNLEFHGYALDSLLRNQAIETISLGIEGLLILLLTSASLCMFQWGGLRFSVALILAMIAINILVAWLFLIVFRIWLPLTELCLTELASFLVFIRYFAVNEEAKLHNILRETNAQIRQQFFPASFADSKEHWSQVITMVNQTLNLERIIFLECVNGDHRVHEVKSLNINFNDIKENRRDYKRPPYSTAIDEGGPVEVQDYMDLADEGEIQYLAPLMFSGEVLGFWAFSACREKLSTLDNYESALGDMAEQIAELLFHRQQAKSKVTRFATPLHRYLSLQGGEQLAESLERTLATLDRRLVGMEDYMNGSSTASVLYTLFGQVQLANREMEQLLLKAKLELYQMTVVDLTCALTHLFLNDVRNIIETIIMHRQKVSLPATLACNPHRYELHLSPLFPVREKQFSHDNESYPFEIKGVLCELIDVTAIKRLSQLKAQLVEQVTYQVRNNTEALLTGVSLLETVTLPENKRPEVISIIRKEVDHLVSVSERANDLLNIDLDTRVITDSYPIDSKQNLLDVIENMRGESTSLGIEYDLSLPEVISLVFASPDGFQNVLESILKVLIRDSVKQGVIYITLEERDGWIIYQFSNQGCGVPEIPFQNYLHSKSELATEQFNNLHQSVIRVNHWGGILDGHSIVGEGIRFELKLRGYI